VDRDRDKTQAVDVDTAGIHPGGGGVLFVEQRLEGGVAAARLQAGGDADAGQQPDARSRSRSFSIPAKSICASTLSTTV